MQVTSYDLANRLAEKLVNKTNDIQNKRLELMTKQRDNADKIIQDLQTRLEKWEGIGC